MDSIIDWVCLDTDWPQFGVLYERLQGYPAQVRDRIEREGLSVFAVGFVDSMVSSAAGYLMNHADPGGRLDGLPRLDLHRAVQEVGPNGIAHETPAQSVFRELNLPLGHCAIDPNARY